MIGDRLRDIRRHEGMSMADLARRSGLSRKTVFDIEHGVVTPTPESVRRLAEALDVSPADFYSEGDLPGRMSDCFATLSIDDQRLVLQMCRRLSLIPRIHEEAQ